MPLNDLLTVIVRVYVPDPLGDAMMRIRIWLRQPGNPNSRFHDAGRCERLHVNDPLSEYPRR